jgi:lipopolysaccharide export system ATP-binding protein
MALKAIKLTKSFAGRKVVDGIELELGRGEVVGLFGPNGAGKTTTFYMLLGLEMPDSGTIEMDGKDSTSMPVHVRSQLGIGYLAQEPSIFRRMSVQANIMSVLQAKNFTAPEVRARTEKMLDEFSLGNIRKQMGYTLSGGERRKGCGHRASILVT